MSGCSGSILLSGYSTSDHHQGYAELQFSSIYMDESVPKVPVRCFPQNSFSKVCMQWRQIENRCRPALKNIYLLQSVESRRWNFQIVSLQNCTAPILWLLTLPMRGDSQAQPAMRHEKVDIRHDLSNSRMKDGLRVPLPGVDNQYKYSEIYSGTWKSSRSGIGSKNVYFHVSDPNCSPVDRPVTGSSLTWYKLQTFYGH